MTPKYTNKNGKVVAGTAAMLHTISQNGGWDNHHDKVILEFIKNNRNSIPSLLAPEQRPTAIIKPFRKNHKKSS